VARYWVYLNDEVSGPYGVDQLIRLRGFSRQTQVCVDEAGNTPKNWISPAEIPELAHIFKAVDEHLSEPAAAAKPSTKPPTIRYPKPFVPAVTLKAPRYNMAQIAGWILLAAVLAGGGALVWYVYTHHNFDGGEKESARALIENVHLPAPSPYGTLPQYFQDKNVKPRWEFEKMQDSLYHVTLSCYAPSLVVYAFEVNLQAQTVRGINTAASQLLSEGFPAPPARKAKTVPVAKKSPPESFAPTLERARTAVEGGDFQTVWNLFSDRKKSEMARGGISEEGFVRLQGLTHRVEASSKQEVLKTKQNSDTEMLVLIKQTQNGRPDVFIKQLWLYENDTWKLDDEQKKASAPIAPAVISSSVSTPTPAPSPASLPGMSN
jgi:hypothetical protein